MQINQTTILRVTPFTAVDYGFDSESYKPQVNIFSDSSKVKHSQLSCVGLLTHMSQGHELEISNVQITPLIRLDEETQLSPHCTTPTGYERRGIFLN